MQVERLALKGDVTIASLPQWLRIGEEFASQKELPQLLVLDLAEVTEFDSATIALMLEWQRKARALGRELRYEHLPANLLSLAELYGVDDLLIACCSDATTMPASGAP
jgi:phospholipid transport system transporter-binding protein